MTITREQDAAHNNEEVVVFKLSVAMARDLASICGGIVSGNPTGFPGLHILVNDKSRQNELRKTAFIITGELMEVLE
jgi:hypothetical protein